MEELREDAALSQLLQLVPLQRNPRTHQVPVSCPPLGPRVTTRTVSPLHLLHVPSLPRKRLEEIPPKSELCPKNETLNPWHPPREQSWVSGGPRTCENVRNPNVWTGFLCLPQTSQHRRHPNGDASRAAVSSLPQLHQLVPPGDTLSARERAPRPVFRCSGTSRCPEMGTWLSKS